MLIFSHATHFLEMTEISNSFSRMVFSDRSLFKLIKSSLDPVFQSQKPSFVGKSVPEQIKRTIIALFTVASTSSRRKYALLFWARKLHAVHWMDGKSHPGYSENVFVE